MLRALGCVDGRYGAREWRRGSGFPLPTALIAQRRVQALGLMGRVEQVCATSCFVAAVRLITSATASREAAVVGVMGIGGGATGLKAGERTLVGCHWRQAQKVWELQVAFV